MVLKILIAATAAGSIIGKGGSTINEFQETSARLSSSAATARRFREPPTGSSRWAEAWQTSSARCT